jgi:protein ImuB
MSRAWKSPVRARDTAPRTSKVGGQGIGRGSNPDVSENQHQQRLPFAEPVPLAKPLAVTPTSVRRLWFCIWLPNLPLEACGPGDGALAIVEEQHGIHRILQADSVASAAGIMPGQSANAALALLPTLRLEERSRVREQQVLEALATWLERFSSFVNIPDKNVLLLEIAGSLRLFDGLPNLRQKVSRGLAAKGFSTAMAIAPTPLAATWLARAGRRACIRLEENLGPALRQLPLTCLDWPAGQRESLTGMGIGTIGDCVRLPREGFARRFGVERLLDLDRALGHLPDPRDSWRSPERFCADYEMTEEQSDREWLLHICRELFSSHEQFLLSRQLGTQRVCFSFFHLKSPATELQLGSALADRSAARWFDLLKIRFERLCLPEAVIAVRLRSGLAQPLQAETERLCFSRKAGKQRRRYSIAQLAERLVARIGDHSVNALTMVAEHRPESAWAARNPLSDWSVSTLSTQDTITRPLWMLSEPALLPVDGSYPLHRGCRLTLLDGPERLETGWWDGEGVSRDYYTAVNGAGIRLWVFRNRQRTPNWYLHGIFG